MNFQTSLNHLFSEITNHFWVRLELTMKKSGLHSGQIFVLISLWNEDGQTQIDLSRNLNLSPPTINKMIKSLSNNGFVKSRRSKTDARKVRVFLTDKGNLIRPRVEDSWKQLEMDFFSSLSETEKLIIQQIFGKLKEHLISKVADQSTDL